MEVLIGKTLEQSLMEVMEEEELAAMRAHQASVFQSPKAFSDMRMERFE